MSQPWWRRASDWVSAHELWLLALAAPFLLFPNRLTPLALGLIIISWLGRWVSRGALIVRSPMNVPVVILVIMTLIGYGVSADPALSEAKLWGIILQAAVFFAVLNNARRDRDIILLLRLLVAGTIILAFVSLVGTDWSQVRLVEAPGIYDRIPIIIRGIPGSGVAPEQELFNPREVGAAVAMLLPLSVVLFWMAPGRWDRPLAASGFISGALVLVLSQALMGFFGLALALLLMAVWWRRWTLWPVLLGLVVLFVVFFIYGPGRLAMTGLTEEDPLGIGVILRIDMWNRALAMIRDMPWTGIGLNTFPLVQTQFYPGQLLGPEPHAHNLFIQTTLDLGLPGLLAFLWLIMAFILTIIYAYRRTTNRDMQLLLIGLSAGVLAYIGSGVLDTMTLGAKPVPVLWAMLGMAGAIASRGDVEEENKPRWWSLVQSRWLLAIFALFIVLGLFLFPSVRNRNQGQVLAQKALVTARQTGELPLEQAQKAISLLEKAIDQAPQNPELYGSLASLYAWQGDYEMAMAAFRQRVTIDGENALIRYAPFEVWRLQLVDQPQPPPWIGALRAYTPWRDRFPARAEGYILVAIVAREQMGDVEQAKVWLQIGLDNGAEPEQLLHYYLNELEV